eukprot:964282-Prymnesium_polylepis.1
MANSQPCTGPSAHQYQPSRAQAAAERLRPSPWPPPHTKQVALVCTRVHVCAVRYTSNDVA